MAIPRFLRRWRLRTLMIVVALVAVILGTYRVWVAVGPAYWLIGQLWIGDVQARRAAAARIGFIGPRAALAMEALKSALDDPDQVVRTQAMHSLVRLGWRSPRLLPLLAEAIESMPEPTGGFSPISDFENDPVDALKMLRPDAAAFVPLLGKALKSPDRWVREAAIESLFAVATWSDPSDPEVAGALLAMLADDRRDPRGDELEAFSLFEDRKRAVEALAKQSPAVQEKGVAQLAGDIRDLGSLRSYEAALLMPRLQGGRAAVVSILLDFIRDGDDTRRRIAMILLGPVASPAEAPAVMRAITAPAAERTINLSGRLSWWESVAAREGGQRFQQFVQGTARTETSLTEPGVQTLKAIGVEVERRAIGDLIAIVREPGEGLERRCCAIIALGEFGPNAFEAIPALDDAIRAHEVADRGASGGFAARESPGALATRALGKIAAEGNPEAIAILARLVADPKATVAPDASWMLLLLGPKARPAVPALVKGLKDPRQVVRAHSVRALGKIGGPEVRAVLPALMAALDDENFVVQHFAAEAVAQYGASAKAAGP